MPAHLLQEEVSAELRAAPRLAALLCLGLAPASFLAASFLRCCCCRRGQPRVSVRAPMGADRCAPEARGEVAGGAGASAAGVISSQGARGDGEQPSNEVGRKYRLVLKTSIQACWSGLLRKVRCGVRS